MSRGHWVSSLNMPQGELGSRYNHQEIEEKIYRLWEESGYFAPENLPGQRKKAYSIHLPPPNITGSLHIGHALNATLSDILIRYHRMRGDKTVWFPGIDHAGIATQNVVEKELKKEGKNHWEMGREKFVERVWQWKEKYGGIILEQLKKLGASADWSRTRFTMDPEYAHWVTKAFIHYYKKGLIYRGKRVINWCPRCQTSLSDLEIEHKEERSKLWYIRYPVANSEGQITNGKYITVATTRPETMLGDSAVAVSPKDKRYKNLIGKTVTLPIQNRKIPIIADESVDASFGTGAVKVTPAHSIADSEVAERHTLPFYEVIDERGKMTAEAGKEFEGLKVFEARTKVVEELESGGLLQKTEDYMHNLAVCYRCGTTLEPLLSEQWFLKMSELAKGALKAVRSGKVEIIPQNFEKSYFAWLENIKDWCISRQIWWGHQLPVWFHEPICIPKAANGPEKLRNGASKSQMANSEKQMSKCEEVIVSTEKPVCKFCEAEYKQSEDVLDTWFSSALWPFAALKEQDMKNFYPSQVLITDRGIINLWVGRMIFSGIEFMKGNPFQQALIHATILTKEGKRMSKSLGTGIDPLFLIDQHGADALRFGIVWQAMGNQDIRWDETAVIAGKKFGTKFWNVARFIISKTGVRTESAAQTSSNADDKLILEKLNAVKKTIENDIENYQFGQALHALYGFIWHDLADKYIEQTKAREDSGANETLSHVLFECLKLLHPFMPFVTEEIYQKLRPNHLLMVEQW